MKEVHFVIPLEDVALISTNGIKSLNQPYVNYYQVIITILVDFSLFIGGFFPTPTPN